MAPDLVSPDLPEPQVLHVERTGTPTVLRWVARRPDLDATPMPPAGSVLAGLLADGRATALSVRRGDVLISFPHPESVADAALVSTVHAAVVAALGTRGWTAPTGVAAVAIRPPNPRDPIPVRPA